MPFDALRCFACGRYCFAHCPTPSASRRGALPLPLARGRVGVGASAAATRKAALFHDLSAGLADDSVLITGAAAATDRADQLAALDQRKSTRTRDQSGIERAYVGMAGFKRVVEQTGFAAEACRGASLAHRNRAGSDLRALHPREMHQFAIGIDHGDAQLPVSLFGFGFSGGHHLLGAIEPDRYPIRNIERYRVRRSARGWRRRWRCWP